MGARCEQAVTEGAWPQTHGTTAQIFSSDETGESLFQEIHTSGDMYFHHHGNQPTWQQQAQPQRCQPDSSAARLQLSSAAQPLRVTCPQVRQPDSDVQIPADRRCRNTRVFESSSTASENQVQTSRFVLQEMCRSTNESTGAVSELLWERHSDSCHCDAPTAAPPEPQHPDSNPLIGL